MRRACVLVLGLAIGVLAYELAVRGGHVVAWLLASAGVPPSWSLTRSLYMLEGGAIVVLALAMVAGVHACTDLLTPDDWRKRQV